MKQKLHSSKSLLGFIEDYLVFRDKEQQVLGLDRILLVLFFFFKLISEECDWYEC